MVMKPLVEEKGEDYPLPRGGVRLFHQFQEIEILEHISTLSTPILLFIGEGDFFHNLLEFL